jgi:fosfomycin resistance protein FosX
MIEGSSHITLIASDLERKTAIIEQVLDGREIHTSGDDAFSLSREKFFMVARQWIAVREGKSLPSRTHNHVAFKIAASSIGECRPRIQDEGQSLHFHDHGNHLVELHAGSLEERLERYGRSPPP